MGDPSWRYGASASARPSSSGRGSIPKPSFPGYLSSEAPAFPNDPYRSNNFQSASTEFLGKDFVPYGVDDLNGLHLEPNGSGLSSRERFNGYPSSLADPNLADRRRIVDSVNIPGFPDVSNEKPSFKRKADGHTPSAEESNILFVDGLPTDCTRREIGHLFRPFIGFRELRVIHKEPRQGKPINLFRLTCIDQVSAYQDPIFSYIRATYGRGDKAMVLCFVEFIDSKCARTAMDALEGYKFDHKKPDSPQLRMHFAHFPFTLPSDRQEQPFGVLR